MSVFTLIRTIHLNVTRKPMKGCSFIHERKIHGNDSVFRQKLKKKMREREKPA